MKGIWKNKKNGRLYEVIAVAVNANNDGRGFDDPSQVVYRTTEAIPQTFYRNFAEFLEKFERPEEQT